ncbi:F-box associated domain type 3 [Arabidopsis suecica]|uniref:F-box associated domain type 3 n=1 Tax=Arabidopsis suecica TaxID=45249 RepID=A0A8T1YPH4_ARASU|nr:F-box associated domain type 3 [Arabidopsis suecica]
MSGTRYSFFGFDPVDKQYKVIIMAMIARMMSHYKLTNYKGKLCLIYRKVNYPCQSKNDVGMELCVWVLEDAEKPEWSKYAYTLWDDKFLVDDDFVDKYPSVVVVGVSSMGEIILSTGDYIVGRQSFYVFYFNPEKNTLQRVGFRGYGECDYKAFTKLRVYTFVNHVEDLNVNDAKILNSSIYAPYVKREEDEEESKGEEDRDDH